MAPEALEGAGALADGGVVGEERVGDAVDLKKKKSGKERKRLRLREKRDRAASDDSFHRYITIRAVVS